MDRIQLHHLMRLQKSQVSGWTHIKCNVVKICVCKLVLGIIMKGSMSTERGGYGTRRWVIVYPWLFYSFIHSFMHICMHEFIH